MCSSDLWSHAISNVPLTSFTSGTTDPFNFNLDKGDSDLDRRHILVSNAVYGLPTFKKWGSLASHVLGDWQLNGIVTLMSGTPLDVQTGISGQYFGLFSNAPAGFRPDLVPGQPIYLHGADHILYLNPAAFALPDPGSLGNMGPRNIEGPHVWQLDIALSRIFQLRESQRLEVRAEAYNVTNSLHPGNPVSNLNSGIFGQINTAGDPRIMQFAMKYVF